MGKWRNCTLADLGEIVGGATPSTKNENYYGGNIPWITPKDLSTFQGRFIRCGERNITSDGLNSCSARLMPSHSILFTSRAPIGYVAIAENEVCTNQGFKSIIPNVNIDYLFLYYLLVYNRDNIENMGSGTIFKEVSGSVMKQITVSVPCSINEQRTIARILGGFDDRIENNNAVNHHLEQMAQAIFKSWFVDFEPFADGGFIKSELGEIPVGWRVVTLADFVSLTSGYSYKGMELQPSNIAMATIKNFERKGGFKTDGFKEIVVTGRIKPMQYAKQFDILVAHTDITQNANVIGNAEMLLTLGKYERVVISLDLVKVMTNIPGFSNFILASILRSPLFKSHALGYVNGTTVLHLSKKAIPEYKVALPINISCLAELNGLLEPIYRRMADNMHESDNLAALRDALLPRLMSGELSVSDVDPDK